MSWLTCLLRFIAFPFWFAKEVVVANGKILWDNLTPGQGTTPGIIRFETRCQTDQELTLLAALITLTPGTLVMGTGRSARNHSRVLFVHGMYAPDGSALRDDMTRMEQQLLTTIRRNGVSS